jgi:hypothetical protein
MILCETEIFSIDENWLPPPLTLQLKPALAEIVLAPRE